MHKLRRSHILGAVAGIGFLGLIASSWTGQASDKRVTAPAAGDLSGGQATDGYALPIGASSLDETYQDWKVICRKSGMVSQCVIAQQLINEKSRQRILTLQFSPSKNQVTGIAIMPFGLLLAKGATLTVDGQKIGNYAFSTCLPTGCVIPFNISNAQFTRISQASRIEIRAAAPDGKDVGISVSPKGLNAATARLLEIRR